MLSDKIIFYHDFRTIEIIKTLDMIEQNHKVDNFRHFKSQAPDVPELTHQGFFSSYGQLLCQNSEKYTFHFNATDSMKLLLVSQDYCEKQIVKHTFICRMLFRSKRLRFRF